MKAIFTLTSIMAISFGALADVHLDGQLTVSNQGKRDVLVEMDGRAIRQADQVFNFYNLEPGYHQVRIVEIKKTNPFLGMIGMFGANRVIYNRRVLVKPRTELMIIINRAGRIRIAEDRIDRRDGKYYGRDNHDRVGRGNGDRHEGDYSNDGPFSNRAPYYREMDDRRFDMLMSTLRRESYDNSRLMMAKQMMMDNYFSTRQVMDMVLLFSFDDKKLDLAKALYAQTVDKENYFQVYNVFSYGRTREELADYIRHYR